MMMGHRPNTGVKCRDKTIMISLTYIASHQIRAEV